MYWLDVSGRSLRFRTFKSRGNLQRDLEAMSYISNPDSERNCRKQGTAASIKKCSGGA